MTSPLQGKTGRQCDLLEVKTTFSFPLSGNMASKPLTPQTAAMASLREFENALESLKSAFCLYAECKDLSDPYDDHQQPRKNELRRTFKRKF